MGITQEKEEGVPSTVDHHGQAGSTVDTSIKRVLKDLEFSKRKGNRIR